MLPFYGRRLSRNTKHFQLDSLKSFEFFFDANRSTFIKKFSLFKTTPLNLEIGFGTGENLVFQSQKYKDENFIACDPFISGSLKLKKTIESKDLSNIFFTNLDYFELYKLINRLTFRKIYILFPDPWPKKRHKKRRLVNLEFISSLKKVISYNSKIFIATDDQDYANQIKKLFLNEKFFDRELFSSNYTHFSNNILCPTKYFRRAMNLKKKVNLFIFKQNKKKINKSFKF